MKIFKLFFIISFLALPSQAKTVSDFSVSLDFSEFSIGDTPSEIGGILFSGSGFPIIEAIETSSGVVNSVLIKEEGKKFALIGAEIILPKNLVFFEMSFWISGGYFDAFTFEHISMPDRTRYRDRNVSSFPGRNGFSFLYQFNGWEEQMTLDRLELSSFSSNGSIHLTGMRYIDLALVPLPSSIWMLLLGLGLVFRFSRLT